MSGVGVWGATDHTGVAFDGSCVWVADDGSNKIFRINSTTGNMLGQISAPANDPQGLAWDGTYLWVCDSGTDKIYRINTTTGHITHQIPTPHTDCRGLAWDGTSLWVVESVTDTVYKLNPTSGAVLNNFASPCTGPRGLAFDGTYLWVSDDDTGQIIRFSTSGVTYGWMRGEGKHPHGLAWQSPKHLWVMDPVLPQLYRLNTNSGLVQASCIPPSSDPRGMAKDGTYIWYMDRAANRAYRITTSGQIINWFPTPGNSPEGVAFDGTYLWISDSTSDKIYQCSTYGDRIWEFNTPGTEPRGVAWDGTYLYNVDKATKKIYRINPSTGSSTAWINTPGGDSPQMLDYALDGLWVSEQDTEKIYFVNATEGDVIHSFLAPSSNPLGVCVYNEYLWTGGYQWNYLYKVNLDVAPPGPTAEFSATPRSGPKPLTVSFTDQSITYEGIVSWFWYFGDGQASMAQNPTHTYTQQGNYTVTLTVREIDNDTDTETKTDYITVSHKILIADFSATPRSGPEPLTVSFTDLSTSHDGVVAWVWSFGDGSTSTLQSPTHTYTQQGTYTVTLTVREADDDTNTETKTDYVTVSDTDPNAGFSATPTTGAEPLTISFTDLSTSHDGIISWVWRFGDGSTSTLQSPTHTYAQQGTYTVTLTVREADDDTNTETKTGYIRVTPHVKPTAGFSATPTTGSEPLTVKFTDQSTSYDGVVAWVWSFGDGSTSTQQSPTHTYTQQGTYTVTLTVREADDDTNTETKTGHITVTDTKPTADLSARTRSGLEPLTVSFTDLSTSYDGVVAWSWSFGDGSTSTLQSPTHIYVQEGTYTVTLTVREADDDTDTETKTDYVTVSDTDPNAGFSATPTTGAEPLIVKFTDQSTSHDGIISWVWGFGDGSTSAEQNPTHTYIQDDIYTVSLTIREDDGNIDTDTMPACITVTDTRPTADLSANTRSGLEPLTVSFTDQSTSHDGIISWVWRFGDGSTSTEQNPTHTYIQDDIYTVSLTIREDDGNIDTDTMPACITVTDTDPNAEFSATPTTGTEPLTISFTDQSTSYDGILAWAWGFGDGSTGETRNPSHIYSEKGSYQVSLTIWEYDSDSDSKTKTRYIVVPEAPCLLLLTILILTIGNSKQSHQG